jgi:hypothetical protein
MISIGTGFEELEKDPAAVAIKAKQFGATVCHVFLDTTHRR